MIAVIHHHVHPGYHNPQLLGSVFSPVFVIPGVTSAGANVSIQTWPVQAPAAQDHGPSHGIIGLPWPQPAAAALFYSPLGSRFGLLL